MKKNNKVNPLTHFNNTKETTVKKAGGEMTNYKKSLVKAQAGGSKDKWGRSSSSDWYGFDPKTKKWTGDKALTPSDLKALRHQKRGMGASTGFYVKKAGSIMNELGRLTPAQQKQLDKNMAKSSTLEKIYEGAPNIGRAVGKSAADIPANSKLQKQKKGGSVKTKNK